ncbi:hypothetical protein GGR34_000862 [Microvirga flocculans]|uniref:Uncharacterized protein n=1 Tax=Microvirga flocculans TaxID=217168 RepID=A0A7W6N729_9HYPH|nr:hypothetical protein [Microvirga flocculans]MBB4039227.1 hypothetical protein [Microvirga flocculans]
MKYISLALFAAASLFFVMGLIDAGSLGTSGTMSHSSWVQNSIALYLASIASYFIFKSA